MSDAECDLSLSRGQAVERRSADRRGWAPAPRPASERAKRSVRQLPDRSRAELVRGLGDRTVFGGGLPTVGVEERLGQVQPGPQPLEDPSVLVVLEPHLREIRCRIAPGSGPDLEQRSGSPAEPAPSRLLVMGNVPSGEIGVALVRPADVGQGFSPHQQELTAAPGTAGCVGA